MAAVYLDEEDVWKCPKHPSKRRRNGICPTCLRDRLISLCPDCGSVRPCSCCSATSSSSSSASSSFKFFSSASSSRRVGGGRISELIDREPPAIQRSRSVGIPFLFSRFAREKKLAENSMDSPRKGKTSSFWSRLLIYRHRKSTGGDRIEEEIECRNSTSNASIEEFANMMSRSRSVSVPAAKGGRGWSFTSVFRQPSTKAAKVANDRSPMCRG